MALIVDSIFGMGGYLAQSITPGAEIVGLSATKWIRDHVIIMGGMGGHWWGPFSLVHIGKIACVHRARLIGSTAYGRRRLIGTKRSLRTYGWIPYAAWCPA